MFLVLFFTLLLPAAATAQEQRAAPWTPAARAEKEQFLLHATIVGEAGLSSGARPSGRVGLDDGTRNHHASVNAEISTSRDASQRDYRSDVAAYELDKALELDLVSPSVERTVNRQPAAVTWWVDDVFMSEESRRQQKIEPPDREVWNTQLQAVRVFDELIANAYRKIGLAFYTSTVWDNLLITNEWRIWLIDHTRAFGTARQLEHPESLTRCDRRLLGNLRRLNRTVLTEQLGKWLTSEQLEALETRRTLIVKHFDERIAGKGEGTVLYDLPWRQ